MIPVQIRPDQALEELTNFSQKLGHGLQNLMEVGDIPTGVTPKEPVYHEDKMVLYRF